MPKVKGNYLKLKQKILPSMPSLFLGKRGRIWNLKMKVNFEEFSVKMTKKKIKKNKYIENYLKKLK